MHAHLHQLAKQVNVVCEVPYPHQARVGKAQLTHPEIMCPAVGHIGWYDNGDEETDRVLY